MTGKSSSLSTSHSLKTRSKKWGYLSPKVVDLFLGSASIRCLLLLCTKTTLVPLVDAALLSWTVTCGLLSIVLVQAAINCGNLRPNVTITGTSMQTMPFCMRLRLLTWGIKAKGRNTKSRVVIFLINAWLSTNGPTSLTVSSVVKFCKNHSIVAGTTTLSVSANRAFWNSTD